MTGPTGDEATLLGELGELIEASMQHGRALERVDPGHAAKAHAAALSALTRIVLRVDPSCANEARALLLKAERDHLPRLNAVPE